MGSVEDYTERYSNDSEALDRWIADCFMGPQPCSSYYCKPISVAAREDRVIPRNDVIIPRKQEKLNSRVYEKRKVQFDQVSALEETQRFVAKFLGTENTNNKKIIVSRSSAGYGVTKPEFVSKSLNTKQHQRDKTSLAQEKQFPVTNDYGSRLKASKRKFDDSDVVKKQKTIPGIVRKRPEKPICIAKPIGKPSLRKQLLATGTHKKYKFHFQSLAC